MPVCNQDKALRLSKVAVFVRKNLLIASNKVISGAKVLQSIWGLYCQGSVNMGRR